MISFIIPAYNEDALLGQTLRALRAAADGVGEEFEIIVADDGSTDRTAIIAREHGAVVISINRRQIAAARNAGAAAARGKYLFFIDADTIVTESPLRRAIDAMRDGAVGGGAAIRMDGATPWYGKLFVAGMMLLDRLCGYASGSFLFCTRRAFDAVGGFDEEYWAAEELVMSKALNRLGRFVLLSNHVVTSGRKLRIYRLRELLAMTFQIAVGGMNAVRDPNHDALRVWYGERREDPRR